MTVAADTASNVVIVSATGALLREVEQTVYYLDNLAQSAPSEDFSVGQLKSGTNPESIRAALARVFRANRVHGLNRDSWIKFAPFLEWWPEVNRTTLRADAVAAVTGAIVVLLIGWLSTGW